VAIPLAHGKDPEANDAEAEDTQVNDREVKDPDATVAIPVQETENADPDATAVITRPEAPTTAVGRVKARPRRALGRARVIPRLRRRRSPVVVEHRRRWQRSSLRTGETVVWIAAIGVLAVMVGFVIRSAPLSAPVTAGPTPTASGRGAGALAPRCVLVACPTTYPPGPPTRVRIPSINVDSTLESLTLNADSVLNAPTLYNEAGWYAAGVVPGDKGPAVIAGHVDSVGGPAVFFRLNTLTPGALVEVERGGVWVNFRVTTVEEYPKDQFPDEKVYHPTPDPELRVITCGGDFDRVHKRYYDNVVVYAVLA
jgi:hypothetical protein